MAPQLDEAPCAIKQGEIGFEELYESAFPSVARLVKKMNGSLDDAADVFHDALIIYHEKLEQGKLDIHVAPTAYLLGITKNLWLRKFNHARAWVPFDNIPEVDIPEDYFPDVNTDKLLRYLETVGRKCLDLLRLFYFEKTTLAKIAQSLNYGSEHSASVQKYKCLEKLRSTIKQQSTSYEDFLV